MLPARLICLPVSEVLGVRGSYTLSEDLSFPPSVLTHHSPTRPHFPRLRPGIFSIFKAYSRANRKQKVKGEKKVPLHRTNDCLHCPEKASAFGQLIKYTDTPALPAPAPGNGDSSRDKEPSATYCLGSPAGGGGAQVGRQKETSRGRASPGLPSGSERHWPSCPGEEKALHWQGYTEAGWAGKQDMAIHPQDPLRAIAKQTCLTARKQRARGAEDHRLDTAAQALVEQERHAACPPRRHHSTASRSGQRLVPPDQEWSVSHEPLGHGPPEALPSLSPMGKEEGRWGKVSLPPGVRALLTPGPPTCSPPITVPPDGPSRASSLPG